MRKSVWNVPNLLTLVRILCIPVLILVACSSWKHRYLTGAALFLLASATDWLDGYLARLLNQTSAFGRFLDPVADKLMVASALIILVGRYPTVWFVVPTIVIISREITISALREWMAEIGKRASVAVSYIGKLKTTAQMMAISLLLAEKPTYDTQGFPVFSVFEWFSFVVLYLAVMLTLWSMLIYLKAAWPDLRRMDR